MIYGNNSSIKLYGEVADNFLESVGVSIFDDGDIAIGESIYDLDTGCDILAENGIILCEDCIVLEGQYADAAKDAINKTGKRVSNYRNKVADKMEDSLNKRTNSALTHLQSVEPLRHKNLDKIAAKVGYPADRMDQLHKKMDKKTYGDFERIKKNYDSGRALVKRVRGGSHNESTIFSDIEII